MEKGISKNKTGEDLKLSGCSLRVSTQEDKKLEWMYKSSTDLINREEYLLGRTIDKSFEVLQAEERRKEHQEKLGLKQSINHVEHECIPFSIRAYREMESNEQVDLQRKVMEDPLMLIRQREIETRKKILENPVKLKELHRILKSDQMLKKSKNSQKTKSKKWKKKAKKLKKASKEKYNSSDYDSSDAGKDLDKELAKKYKKLNKQKDFIELNLTKLLEAKFETITKELDKASKSKHKKSHHRSCSTSSDKETFDERRRMKCKKSDHEENRKEESGREKSSNCSYGRRSPRKNYRRSTTRSRSYSRSRKDNQRRQRSPAEPRTRQYSTSPSLENGLAGKSEGSHENRNEKYHSSDGEKKSRGRDYKDRKRESRNTNSRSKSPKTGKNRTHKRQSAASPQRRSRSPQHSEKVSVPSTSSQSQYRQKKLSDAEKEARLREMMENANWHEEARVKSVQKYREENSREEERYKAQEFDKEFINKEVRKAIANQSSVGSRIRSNFNNVQRTSAAMNSNFTRK